MVTVYQFLYVFRGHRAATNPEYQQQFQRWRIAKRNLRMQELHNDESTGPPPVIAPWDRPNIPDYGELSSTGQAITVLVIGTAFSLLYEYTGYFDQVDRYLAYFAIWFPLLLSFVANSSPNNVDLTPSVFKDPKDIEKQRKKELYALKKELEVID